MPQEQAAQPQPEQAHEKRAERLSRNRDFKVLLVSQGISALGDAVSFTALPLLVLALTGSALATGVVGALQMTARTISLGLQPIRPADRRCAGRAHQRVCDHRPHERRRRCRQPRIRPGAGAPRASLAPR